MTTQSREIWSKQDLLNVAKRQKDLIWLLVMNFLVATICLGPILAVASAAIEAKLTARATGSPAAAQPSTEPSATPATAAQSADSAATTSQPMAEANSPPAAAAATPPGLWEKIVRSMARFGAAIAMPVDAVLFFVAWGYVIPGAVILSSVITIFCNRRLATAVRGSAAWHYINPLLMTAVAVIVAYYYRHIAVAFAASEPWAYVVLVMLSMLSLGALFPLVRLDAAATSLLDRHGIAFGAFGAKLDHFEPHDIRRYRCPKCQVELLPEQEFWDGAHPKCIRCGTVGERLAASGATAAPVTAAPAR